MDKWDHERMVKHILENTTIPHILFTPPDQRYNRLGQEIDYKTWAYLANYDEYCEVSRDKMVDGILLSTQWVGVNTFGTPIPHIFHTWVHCGNDQLGVFYFEDEKSAVHHHSKLVFLHEQHALFQYLEV